MTTTELRSADPNNTDNLVGCFKASDQMNHFPSHYRPSLRSHFEHGQWWIQDTPSGASWSVNDAEENGEDYYDFELVSDGDEDCFQDDGDDYEAAVEDPDDPFTG
jgi:hypothetical protein